MNSVEAKYDAFISYRHIPRDAQTAERLHKALETYRTPKYLVKKGIPARLKKVFRDREELPTSSDLGQDVENALLASRFLIVVCSPEAARSQWVLREVAFFGEHHGYDKILTLLLDDEPANAFPTGLIRYQYDNQGAVSKVTEPLAADIRPRSGASSLKLLKTEKLRLLASILGCEFDDLRQREQERRVRRTVTTAASVASFLLAITVFTLWQLNAVSTAREVAVKNEQITLEAKAKAQDSEQSTLGAQSDLYAMLAKRAADTGDCMLGMSLAMEALPKDMENPERPITQDAKDALYYSAVQSGMQVLTYLYPPSDSANEGAVSCFFTGDGSIVTTGDRAVRKFSIATGRLEREWLAEGGFQILAVSPQADKAVIAHYASGMGMMVQLWDIQENRMVMQHVFDTGDNSSLIDYHLGIFDIQRVVKAGFTKDGKKYYIACNEYSITNKIDSDSTGSKASLSYFDSISGNLLDFPKVYFDYEIGDILLNGNYFAAALIRDFNDDHKNIIVYDILKGAPLGQYSTDDYANLLLEEKEQLQRMGITSDGKTLAFSDTYNTLHIVSVDTGEAREILTHGCCISSHGNLAAFFNEDEQNNRQFVVLDLRENTPVLVLKQTFWKDIPAVQNFIFSSDGCYILFNDYEMLDIQKAELYKLPCKKSLIMCADFDANGRYLASLDYDGVVTVHKLKDSKVQETVVSAVTDEVVIRDNGVLLFEKQSGGGTTVRRWDATERNVTVTLQEEDTVLRLTDISCGDIGFISEDSGDFLLIDMDTGQVKNTFSLKFTKDFQQDLSGKYVLANNGDVHLYDSQTGQQIRLLTTATQGDGYPAPHLRSVGFFPGGKYCWSAVNNYNDEDRYTGIVIHEIATGRVVSHIDLISVGGSSFFSALTSSDGTRMVVQAVNNLQLWSIDNNMKIEHICDLYGGFLCMDDSMVITNSNIYDMKTGRLMATIKSPEASVFEGIISNDSNYLLTVNAFSSGSEELKLWDCNTGKAVATLYNDYSVDADIVDFGLVNHGTEIVIISKNNSQTYIRTIPFFSSFKQVYTVAQEKLTGRLFDQEQDLEHLQ